jgi:hypothetical protein
MSGMGLSRGMLRLAGSMIPRTQQRMVEQRAEPRHEHLADRAILTLRAQIHLVPVINVSVRGIMIESELVPHIGESVVIQLEDRGPIDAYVRWVRDGRIGLNFRHDVNLG